MKFCSLWLATRKNVFSATFDHFQNSYEPKHGSFYWKKPLTYNYLIIPQTLWSKMRGNAQRLVTRRRKDDDLRVQVAAAGRRRPLCDNKTSAYVGHLARDIARSSASGFFWGYGVTTTNGQRLRTIKGFWQIWQRSLSLLDSLAVGSTVTWSLMNAKANQSVQSGCSR